MAEFWVHAEPQREVQEALIPQRRTAGVGAEDHELRAIVQAALRDPTKGREGMQVAPEEGAGVRPPDELDVQHP